MDEIYRIVDSYSPVRRGSSFTCILPDCRDTNPSAGLYEKDGKVRYKCFSCNFCGDAMDLKKKLGIMDNKYEKKEKIFPSLDSAISSIRGDKSVYRYTDPKSGSVDLCIVRIDGHNTKTFIQLTPCDKGWRFGGCGETRPLFNRTRLSVSPEVVVVEGEKCVIRLHKMGIVATTSPCGANAASKADWSPLYGKKVIIWPDNDDAGKKYADTVKSFLQDKCELRFVDVSGFLPKQDAADLDDETVKKSLANAKPETKNSIIDLISSDLEATFAGLRRTIEWPWPCISRLTQCLRPGAVTVLCGDPGASKSFFSFQAMCYWHENGIKFAAMELEESLEFWIYRALAHKSGVSKVCSLNWRGENQLEMSRIFVENSEWIESFGRRIICKDKGMTTTESICEWIDKYAPNNRLLVIDPITARLGGKAAEEDLRIIGHAKDKAMEHGCSILLVTHPKQNSPMDKKGRLLPHLNSIAGGSAIARFCTCILWLEYQEEEEESLIGSTFPSGTINRRLHILKARDADANRVEIGLKLTNLNFKEVGVIRK